MPVEDLIYQAVQTKESPFQQDNLHKHPNFSPLFIKVFTPMKN